MIYILSEFYFSTSFIYNYAKDAKAAVSIHKVLPVPVGLSSRPF